jgi:hypothetical protein
MKKIITALFISISALTSFSQTNPDTANHVIVNHKIIDSLNPKYNLLIPIGETILLNLGVGANNAYITKEHYAQISFSTIAHNFDTGFVWDHDAFMTNQFSHPFHGNLYFNIARSNGYNFWESAPFAFGGSLMWELFMENEPPSVNDLISTTMGGIMLGEMTHRISSLIIDERKTGFNRYIREIFAGLINLPRGINRLWQGKTFRKTNVQVYEKEEHHQRLAIGISNLATGSALNLKELKQLYMNYQLTYGTEFKEKILKPFDFFKLNAGIIVGKSKPSSHIFAYGSLWGQNFRFTNNQYLLLGVFQDYDFTFSRAIYQIGAQSVGPGLVYKFPDLWKFNFHTTLHINPIILGAINSIYREGDRTYNFGYGIKGLFEAVVNWNDIIVLYIEGRYYGIKTLSGAKGKEMAGFLNPRLSVIIYKGLGLGIEYYLYGRIGKYPDKTITRKSNEQRVFLSYLF